MVKGFFTYLTIWQQWHTNAQHAHSKMHLKKMNFFNLAFLKISKTLSIDMFVLIGQISIMRMTMSSIFFKQFKQKWQKSQESTLGRNIYTDVRHGSSSSCHK